jgi:c-di-GMP-binding flagellar brake protein YcgR
MEENMLSEKRKHTRVAVDAYVTATLTVDKESQERLFISKDMSPRGLFLFTNESLPQGTILNLKIHTRTTLKPIEAETKVVRIAKDKDARTIGLGLVINKINEVDRKELYKHLYLAYHYTK